MSLQSIPADWREAVVKVLRRGDSRQISFTKQGYQRWSVEFPCGERYQIEAAFRAALDRPDAVGCPVQMDYPSGTTWEFYFVFQKEKLYGKILLKPAMDRILILSAHRPIKSKLRCE